jgi:isoprenylcysteine carboxyl methyltransferase (ICMT) family protein YpbQ
MFMALSGLQCKAGLFIRLCAVGNLGTIWSTCGQHEIQYIEREKRLHSWIGHIIRHNKFVVNILEGAISGK